MKPRAELVDWGIIPYTEALARQKELFDALVATKKDAKAGADANGNGDGAVKEAGTIVMCEHPHVYTMGKSGRVENLLVSERFLRDRGAEFHRTDRGGDITYHGPGQLVCYPIVDLEKLGMGLRDYVDVLERSVIETLAEFGIEATRVEGRTGVWVVDDCCERKICAIGVRSSQYVTMHGLALNVSTDLEWFRLINPCGMAGGSVTSICFEVGRKQSMERVKKLLAARLAENLGATYR
ncbi:MAG: lipoyl(octanoyl) transferase LipB [Alistipes sp.]|jgi:lipoyl(octanoyl) transferase|nr:lipoyl(octanoyl) transferase LipB [Alistipes sp.]